VIKTEENIKKSITPDLTIPVQTLTFPQCLPKWSCWGFDVGAL